MDFSIPRCTPEEVGIPSPLVEHCIRSLSHPLTTMNGFMAARHGKIFSECWWTPYHPEIPHSNHSFGKTYTASAIGIAAGEGLVRLDEKIVDIFRSEIEEKNIHVPDGVERITVEHVLTMTNGMAYHPDMRGDFVANYLSTPLAYEPGTHFAYNSTGSCMLGAIILKRSGMNMREYLTPRLFQKIGIEPDQFIWRQFRESGIDAEPGTFSTTQCNLRLAMCYLQGGRWNTEQVIPEEYVRSALTVHTSTAHAPEQKDGLCGYGYQLWACSIPGVFRFDGGQGQYGILWPEKDLAIAIHEGALGPLGPQKTLDVIYGSLLDHITDDAALQPDDTALRSLRKTEAEAALPSDPASPRPPDRTFSGYYTVESGVFDPWMSASPPGNGDLFTLFRNPEKDIPIKEFRMDVAPEECRLILDTGAVLRASWNGALTHHFVESPFDSLGDYAASAQCGEDGSLLIHFHWLNGWFETTMRFARRGSGLSITTRKLRLNEDDNFLIYEANAVRRKEPA